MDKRMNKRHEKYKGLIYTRGPNANRTSDCIICCSEMAKDELTLRHSKCQNVLCRKCFEDVLETQMKQYDIATCPFCRGSLISTASNQPGLQYATDNQASTMVNMPPVSRETVLMVWEAAWDVVSERSMADSGNDFVSNAASMPIYPGVIIFPEDTVSEYASYAAEATLRSGHPRVPSFQEFATIVCWRTTIFEMESSGEIFFENLCDDILTEIDIILTIEMDNDTENHRYSRRLVREYLAARLAALHGFERIDRREDLVYSMFSS